MKLSSIRSQSVTLVHCKSGKISEWAHWSLPNRTNPKGFSGRTDFDILLVDLFVPGSLSSRSGFCSHVMAMWLSWHNSAHVTRFLTKLQFLLIVWSLGRLCGRVNPRVPFVKGLLGTYFLQRIHANMLCNHRSWAGVCGEKWWPAVGSCSCHVGLFSQLAPGWGLKSSLGFSLSTTALLLAEVRSSWKLSDQGFTVVWFIRKHVCFLCLAVLTPSHLEDGFFYFQDR